MRIAIGGLWHETNTFVPSTTSLADFRRYQFHGGERLLEEYKGTGTELGGMIEAARELGVQLVPLSFAAAVPSGLVEREAAEFLIGDLAYRAESCGPLDGAVLTLHGAMVADGHSSPESELLQAVRKSLGGKPIGVTLDLHANVDPRLNSDADVILAYDTYPHVDMAQRGAEALRLVVRMLVEQTRPEGALVTLPLLTVPQTQETGEEPLRGLMTTMHQLEERPDVWTASLIPGYPYSDVTRLGFSIYVAAENDAGNAAEELADAVWNRRAEFVPELLSAEEALAVASDGDWPVALVEVADNVGGGSPGNGLSVLRALLDRGSGDAAVVIWDPEAATGAHISSEEPASLILHGFDLEGSSQIELRGRVERRGKITYRRPGPYMRGQLVDMGHVAVVHCPAGRVVVTENRVMPFDDAHMRVVGIEPEAERILVVKGATAWKAGLGTIVRRALYTSGAGYCPSDLSRLGFNKGGQHAYPVDPAATRRDVSFGSASQDYP